MELTLQARAAACLVSGRAFREGDRVVSFLLQTETGEVARADVLEAEAAAFVPAGFVVCRWVQVFKPRLGPDAAARNLRLTAETLFLTLADPATELSPENARLVRFLALMLERKRVLRPKGLTADRTREVYEHARSKQLHEVPAVDLTPEFFAAVQSQLTVLVGGPALPVPPEIPSPAAP
jgi:hypothetical protein